MKAVLPTLILATSISAGFISSAIAAPNSVGYLTDSSGNVVKNSYGLCWRTGSWTSALATHECDPDLVAKAPAPPLVVASPPVAKAPVAYAPHIAIPVAAPPAVNVTLSSDELFSFNRAVINPDQRSQLDAFLKTLAADNVESIAVTGYTDRIGGVSYNMKLSLARANAVKAEMIKNGIPEYRIHVEGKGKNNPVTQPGQCKGPTSLAVIKCLQPDRRVDVKVTGTRKG